MAAIQRCRHEAMATWFEIRIASDDAEYATKAAREAFRVVDQLEQLLSRFRENSEVSAVSRLAAGESLTLHPDTFACLALALEMHALSGGAFDPTLGSSAQSGAKLALNPATFSVFLEEGAIAIDLGAIGKGFALDRAGDVLTEWDAGPALLIAGGSSILAVGDAAEPWLIGVTNSWDLHLSKGSVGTSGLAVKGHHIVDPRTRAPAHATPARAWALSGSAAVSDALSTAFMLLDPADIHDICAERPECAGALQRDLTVDELQRFGSGLGVTHRWTQRPAATGA